MGIIIRDKAGEIVAAMASPKKHIQDPKFLEATAVAQGIQLAMELGIARYIIETDCLGVVEQVTSNEEDLSAIGHVV